MAFHVCLGLGSLFVNFYLFLTHVHTDFSTHAHTHTLKYMKTHKLLLTYRSRGWNWLFGHCTFNMTRKRKHKVWSIKTTCNSQKLSLSTLLDPSILRVHTKW